MAIVRCQDHPPRTNKYVIAVKPVGFPDTALVCGRGDENHKAAGWVFLLSDEHDEFREGKRVFNLWGPESRSSAAKVRVSEDTVKGLNKWVDTEAEDESESNPLQSQTSIDKY